MKTNDLKTLPPINPTPWIQDDREHDDLMDADALDRRRAIKDGWISNWGVWDGR